jgi:hypothetical protein
MSDIVSVERLADVQETGPQNSKTAQSKKGASR